MRGPADWLVLALAASIPLAFAPFAERRSGGRRPFVPGLAAVALGFVAFGASLVVRWGARRLFGVEAAEPGATDAVAIAFAFLVGAPLDESLRAAAVVLPLRSKRLRRPYDAMRLAIGAAAGFSAASIAVRLAARPPGGLDVVRAALDGVAHVSLSSLWGYALGAHRRRTIGGRTWGRGFLLAVVVSGLVTHLLWVRGPSALFAAAPLVAAAGLASLVARRDLLRLEDATKARLSRFLPVAPPSLDALREALRRPERPMTVRWIVIGALVTTGVLTTAFAASIWLGHYLGVDFAAVEETGALEKSAPPLVLIGVATLGAFPVSGFLVARASAARSVLEAAVGASIAIVAIVVLMGVAAPVAIVFGLALAPVAFGLACAGAWVGIER